MLRVALLITAGSLIFRTAIVQFHRSRFRQFDERRTALVIVLLGAVLGVLVTISSVGVRAVGVVALIILYPHLRMAGIVASDIAHAVPLTLVAGGSSIAGIAESGYGKPGDKSAGYLQIKTYKNQHEAILFATSLSKAQTHLSAQGRLGPSGQN